MTSYVHVEEYAIVKEITVKECIDNLPDYSHLFFIKRPGDDPIAIVRCMSWLNTQEDDTKITILEPDAEYNSFLQKGTLIPEDN